MSKQRWLPVLLFIVVLAGAAWAAWFRQPPEAAEARVIGLPGPESSESLAGYERAEGPRELAFPRDHGPHPDFLTEWWYYTGNLAGEDGRRFGYQLTFFRRAAQPPNERAERESNWGTGQVYMAHFTVSDISARVFHSFERFERGAAGLAGAAGEPAYSVWLRDWIVEQVGEDTYRLRAAEGEVALDLTLVDRKGIVLQGEQGYSQKGPERGNASLYYSQTRLESIGIVTVGETAHPVSGWSWLDREISTSALSEGQVGWDWFALQMDDNSELMVYVLRRADGSVDAFSSGIWVGPDGATRTLSREDFKIEPSGTWRSPRSGGEYPARWQVSVPSLKLELSVEPLLADQELEVSIVYWEGAVRVEGQQAGQAVRGFGYVELTGYTESLEGEV